MAEFDRRSFLGASFGLAATASMPEWLARALAIQESVSTWRLQQLRAAIERARKDQKPLLVMVVPDQNDRDVRGMWFAAWLASRCDANLHLTSSCELVCATTAELGDVLRTKLEAGAVFVLADAPAVDFAAAPRVTPIACDLPDVPLGGVPLANREETRKRGLSAMDTAVQSAVAQHGLTLAEFAARAMRRLNAEQRQAIDGWFRDRVQPTRRLQTLAAAEITRRCNEASGEGAVLEVLRESMHKMVLPRPVAGARWYSSGCGGGFEDPTKAELAARAKAMADYQKAVDALGKNPPLQKLLALEQSAPTHIIACGIARMAYLENRFLEFWTAGD